MHSAEVYEYIYNNNKPGILTSILAILMVSDNKMVNVNIVIVKSRYTKLTIAIIT